MICAAVDCDRSFTPTPRGAPGRQRFCSNTCRARVWWQRRYADPAFREGEQARGRDAYYSMDGFRYSKRLLDQRRFKALRRQSARRSGREATQEG